VGRENQVVEWPQTLEPLCYRVHETQCPPAPAIQAIIASRKEETTEEHENVECKMALHRETMVLILTFQCQSNEISHLDGCD
jgi:hypothetical protein